MYCIKIIIIAIHTPVSYTHLDVYKRQIKLYTSESPNHPGKYRIYKSFNRGTKVAYGEFEDVYKRQTFQRFM